MLVCGQLLTQGLSCRVCDLVVNPMSSRVSKTLRDDRSAPASSIIRFYQYFHARWQVHIEKRIDHAVRHFRCFVSRLCISLCGVTQRTRRISALIFYLFIAWVIRFQNASSVSVQNGDIDMSFPHDVNLLFDSNMGIFCFHGMRNGPV